MRVEFKRGLLAGSDLDGVKSGLLAEAEREHKRVVRSIERDFLAARLILEGMREPETSQAFKLARAFMDDFERQHGDRKEIDPQMAKVIRLLKGEEKLTIDDDADGGVTDGTAEPGKAD